MATDWTKLRLEYVHGTITLRALADKHGVKAAGVMGRAAKEGWEADRKQESAKVSKAVSKSVGDDKIKLLAKFNDDDLKISREVKARAVEILHTDGISPNDLRALASTFESARKLGLAALGVDDSGRLPENEESAVPVSVTIERKSARLDNASAE